MESNCDAGDDQSSGWREVKKKHRTSSKGFVGGLMSDLPSGVVCKHSDRNGKSNSKRRSRPSKTGPDVTSHSQVGAQESRLVAKEVEKATQCLDKCVVDKDGELPSSPKSLLQGTANREVNSQVAVQNLDIVPKIKWGDLEDDALVVLNKNSSKAAIKFGNIGDGNLVFTKSLVNDDDLVSCDPSCMAPQEDKAVVVTESEQTHIGMQSFALVEKSSEEICEEIKEISSKNMELPDAKEEMVGRNDVGCHGEVRNEQIMTVSSDAKDGLDSSCPVSDSNAFNGIAIAHLGPEDKLEENLLDISEVAVQIGVSSTLNDEHSVSPPPVHCGPESSGDMPVATVSESLNNPGDVEVNDDFSKGQFMNALGESESGESKERFRERLWCFLFENLNRAVDELYLLCELECDSEQMKEAILVLEEAGLDFRELRSRVEGFEKVKRPSSQPTVDPFAVNVKNDLRRPHALSWEVRRMTSSPQRAEILSSSLEAFKKIQNERSSLRSTPNAKAYSSVCVNHNVHTTSLRKSAGKDCAILNVSESAIKARKQNRASDLGQGNLSAEKRNMDGERSGKGSLGQNGHNLAHSTSIYDSNASEVSLRDSSDARVFGTCNKELLGSGSESVRQFPKKDKVPTDVKGEKIPKSTDPVKRLPLLTDKEKEKRMTASWKSMNAWKEKRNWEDILASPLRTSSRVSNSSGMSRKSVERARVLHDKLMSPEKKKKTALDLKKEAEEKHARATRIRSEIENERAQRLQRTSEKLNRVNEWQAFRSIKLREGMHARHQRSESRHEAYLAQVVRRAGDESSKVNEVRFITSLNEESKKFMLRQKLQDSELRRAEKLQIIKSKQKEDTAREEAVLERRKLLQAEKLQRLAEIQRKKEEAQVRREEERKASSAAREAKTIEQLRRKEIRAKAQQEEAELLAQKLAERLRESEQRRKFYLEQIRERASMDFRDQSSPLLRRSSNRDSLGRSTSTSNIEDYQASSTSGLGGTSLGSADTVIQHSLKRRIKKIRQKLMALKYEFPEPPAGAEIAGVGYRNLVGIARAKIGRWIQELQRLRQARKEGAPSIGLIVGDMIKFLVGKEAELNASRQAGLLDFIASALPASHTSKPEACQVTIYLLRLLKVVLSIAANRSYFLVQNLLPPIIPMLSAALENYIKIAASLNIPGSSNVSSKTSVENFESVSEVLDGFLWTVTTIIGHVFFDERQLQMQDSLLELVIAYQVIHRLRDLFALYDRPQVEGSPFPSAIILSLNLLAVLTSRPRTISSIDWGYHPPRLVTGNENQEAKPVASLNVGDYSVCMASGDSRAPLPMLNVIEEKPPLIPEDSPLNESGTTHRHEKLFSANELEKELTDYSIEDNPVSTNLIHVTDASVESKRSLIEGNSKSIFQTDERSSIDMGAVPKMENIQGLKHPVDFLLSVIAETGLVSLPSLLTAVLLQANNRLSSEQGSYVLPSNFEEVSTGVLKVLNNMALLDITLMQRMLATPDLKMEFFHLMSFLLSHCTSKWKIASDQVGLLLLESLLLLGYFSLFHPGNQAVLRWGKSPTILHKVCDLPFVFFSDPELMPILAGALVAACYGCEQNRGVVQQELSTEMLLSLLKSCRNASLCVQSDPAADDICDLNQLGPEPRKSQGFVPTRTTRHSSRSTRLSSGKSTATVSNSRIIKVRNQKDSKATRTCEEEWALKHNLPASGTSSSFMLHCRFPSSFIDKAEEFFSAEIQTT